MKTVFLPFFCIMLCFSVAVSGQTGSTCADPILITDIATEEYTHSANSGTYGNNYTNSPCNPQFMLGSDVIYRFSIPDTGFLSGGITGNNAAFHILDSCPNTAILCIAYAGGNGPITFSDVAIGSGTYYAVVSSNAMNPSVNYTINLSYRTFSDASDILSFTFPEASKMAIIDNDAKTVDIEVSMGTDITSLIAAYEVSPGAIVKVNDIVQESGVTANDFSAPVTYRVIAEDGNDSTDWTVSVTEATSQSNKKKILSYGFDEQDSAAIIDSLEHTVNIRLKYGTNVTNLVATFTLSFQAKAEVGGVPQESGVTVNDFSGPLVYTVMAEDSTTQDWIVTVTVAEPLTGAFCSDPIILSSFPEEPLEELSGNTSGYMNNYANSPCDPGTIAGEEVIYQFTLTDSGYLSGGVGGNFVGMHVLAECPDVATQCVAYAGGATGGNFNDIAVQAGTYYLVISSNNFSSPAAYTMNMDFRVPNNKNEIVDFGFPEQVSVAVIDPNNRTIDIEVSMDTDVSELLAEFSLSVGAVAKINNVEQISGVTANDFSTPVTYWVIAENTRDSSDWVVSVSVATSLSSENDFLEYSFAEQASPALIDINNHTIDISVVYGTDITTLTAEFKPSYQSSVDIDGVQQQSGITINDFTDSLTYTVTAEDGSLQDWIVTVAVETSVNAVVNDNMKIYPVPANNELNICCYEGDFSVELIDGRGNLVLHVRKQSTIDVSKLIPGVYIIRIMIKNMVHTRRIVIE